MGKFAQQSGLYSLIDQNKEGGSFFDACLEMLKANNLIFEWYQRGENWHLVHQEEIVYQFQAIEEISSFLYGLTYYLVKVLNFEEGSGEIEKNPKPLKDLSFKENKKEETLLQMIDGIHDLNKILLQFSRYFGISSESLYYLYTHDELSMNNQVSIDKKSASKWITIYESKHTMMDELHLLADKEIDNFRLILRTGQFDQVDLKRSLPILIAFFDRLHLGISWHWLEDTSYLKEGGWLQSKEPWKDVGQWESDPGKWFLFIGHHLTFIGFSKEDFASFLLGVAFGAKDYL